MVWAHASGEQRIAIKHQVMRRNSRCDTIRRGLHKFDSLFGSDMFKHHTQPRKTPQQRNQYPIYKNFFAIENIHLGINHFTMHQQRHIELFHRCQCRFATGNIRDTRIRMRSCPGRIELDPMHKTAFLRPKNFFRCSGIRKVQRHQRFKPVNQLVR